VGGLIKDGGNGGEKDMPPKVKEQPPQEEKQHKFSLFGLIDKVPNRFKTALRKQADELALSKKLSYGNLSEEAQLWRLLQMHCGNPDDLSRIKETLSNLKTIGEIHHRHLVNEGMADTVKAYEKLKKDDEVLFAIMKSELTAEEYNRIMDTWKAECE